MNTENTVEERHSLLDDYVFMDKTQQVLAAGLKTEKNVVLYGPGGHGKSEYTVEFMRSVGVEPYVITMGTGITTDRLFGGMNLKEYDASGKIEYLVENSFMNHEYVILEELFDAPDYILEQMKDILSSGQFRNGTQIFDIKTRFIVGCTNKTRDEFSKNLSLKALMERFPLELNVIWPNYTEASYNLLLEKRFGVGRVDPIIPFLLQEYAKANLTISPRVALDCYELFIECGPDVLVFVADLAKKTTLINDTLAKFEATIKFKKLGSEMQDLMESLAHNDVRTLDKKRKYVAETKKLVALYNEVKAIVVNDDLVQAHSALTNLVKTEYTAISAKSSRAESKIAQAEQGIISGDDEGEQGVPEPAVIVDESGSQKEYVYPKPRAPRKPKGA